MHACSIISRLFLICALCATSFIASAENRLVPSNIITGGGCSAIHILAKNTLNSRHEIAFFTDACGGPKDLYFLGINGKTHQLMRLTGDGFRPPFLAGTYSGDGLKVEVHVLGKGRKYYGLGFPKIEENVVLAKYRATVAIDDGLSKEVVVGQLVYGR